MSTSLEHLIEKIRQRETPYRLAELPKVVGDSRETWLRRCVKGTYGVKLKHFRTGQHVKVHPDDLIEFLLAINARTTTPAPVAATTPAAEVAGDREAREVAAALEM